MMFAEPVARKPPATKRRNLFQSKLLEEANIYPIAPEKATRKESLHFNKAMYALILVANPSTVLYECTASKLVIYNVVFIYYSSSFSCSKFDSGVSLNGTS